MNERNLLKISVLLLTLNGCAAPAPGTYEEEVCQKYDTQWNSACPKNYILIEGEGIKLPDENLLKMAKESKEL